MRNIFIIFMIALASNANAKDCGIEIISFSVTFANSFENNELLNLDDIYCLTEKVAITVEHSISGEGMELNDEAGEITVKSFKELNQWLDSRRVEERPWPAMWPLTGCKDGICEFGGRFANQVHGYLFLKEIYYKEINNQFFITRIVFEDGD